VGWLAAGNTAAENIALNPDQTGYPHPLESDHGWGGGQNKWDIVDGLYTYPGEWARGLAFTGGSQSWGGEPAGLRQATIDFGTLQEFSRVILWHHGNEHVPAEAGLEYWNGISWIEITFERTVSADPASSWSQPDTYDFAPVTGSKVRWWFDNSGLSILGVPITHGWLYEFEVYDEEIPISGACCRPNGLCQVMPESACEWLGGSFAGADTDCGTVDCPPAVTGSIVAWGMNDYGECDVPPPNEDFVSIAAGYCHSLGLRPDGSIVAWGCNDYGQCDVPEPNSDFVAVAAGNHHSLGLKADGSIVAWGWNHQGQCDVPEPNTDFVVVAGGYFHSLGIKSDGALVAWGWNLYGQCDVPEPNSDFVAAGGGVVHSLGLEADGSVVAWGRNDHGQCELPDPNEDFVAIAVGAGSNMALRSPGTIVAWGWNEYGQCAVPDPNADFVAITAGYWHGVGLKSYGEIVAWGDNEYGQCDVPPPSMNYLAIASIGWHTMALKAIPDPGRLCDSDAWSTFDVKDAIGARGGYQGGVSDGRYIYLVPLHDGTVCHGEVARYDTQAEFDDPSSWELFDAAGVATHVGYSGGTFDGRYVYFAPAEDQAGESHGEVLRFDTLGEFTDAGAWNTFDASTIGEDPRGYSGAVYDGTRYVYFVPSYTIGSGYHGEVLRYDTWGNFTNPWSWQTYDPGAAGVGTDPDGYIGAVCDGRYVYFVPFKNAYGPAYHGEVLRYDTQAYFSDPLAWATFDAQAAPEDGGVGAKGGYAGAAYDGRHIYFVPVYDGVTYHREVLRYDTQQDFFAASAWTLFDAADVGLGSGSYYGAAFDGRHVYFAPNLTAGSMHGEVLRYDTTAPFTATSSWGACTPAVLGVGSNPRGYNGAVAKGRYVYFVPYSNSVEHHGEVLRFDTSAGRGDMNCDGRINSFDIDPFVRALTDPGSYEPAYPECDVWHADIDGDGWITAFDIDPFVQLLTGAD
jgi:hypothetical protein